MMGKSFKGVWGSFEFIDDATGLIRALREQGKDYSVLSPFPHYELEDAMGKPQSRIPFITLVFGAFGIFMGYAMTSWMSMDWVLPVSAKPTVSIPPYTIFAFELMVLLGGLATAAGIFLLGFIDLGRKRLPGSDAFKQFGRFSNDRFGVVVRCEEGDAAAVEQLMRAHHVEEVVREF